MSEIITFPLPAGPNFTIPDVGDENWGQSVTDYLVALPNGVPPTSGTFSLTGDLGFGPTFGLLSQYFKTLATNPAASGLIRLAKTDTINWRNQINTADNILAVNSSNILTFNGNPVSVTTGNLTDAGTDGIVITGGTNAVVGSGTSLAQHVSDTIHNGYLSSTDWNTFNGKQAAGSYITALTGDGTASGPGSSALTLATVNSNVGLFTNAHITVNAKGLITAASSGTIGNLTDAGTDGITVTGGTGAVLGSGTSLSQHVADATHNGYLSSTDWSTFNSAAGGGITSLTGDVTGTGPGATATTLATVNSNVGTFTAATITVNAKGLIIAASNSGASGIVDTGSAGNIALYNASTSEVGLNYTQNGHNIQFQIGSQPSRTSALSYSLNNPGNGIATASLISNCESIPTANAFVFSGPSGTILGATTTSQTIAFAPNFSSLTASTALALDGSKNLVSVTNTGTGNNVLATSPTLTTPNIGAATMGGNLNANSNKITNLTAGTAATDAVNFSQLGVIQTVVSTAISSHTVSSTSFADSSIGVTITPKFSTSRVKVTFSGFIVGQNSNQQYFITIKRGIGGTDLSSGTNGLTSLVTTTGTGANLGVPCTIVVIDSPATTSSTTYELYAKSSAGTILFGDGANQTMYSMIAEEIQ